ncbi:hypothetical protein [Nonomuraea aridisoli]|uniref:Uncharacterized protein n=1 Tax=Nonomuraea aridisoli TaxID=2070368 RepID=A0A2W2EW86_9ACTN|nr:hypothetical protein [Nonomuraea aridisoli]PZG13647.1 hypothetical protein C1J01_29350 [Nonomuraea aridisoli]
MTQPPDEHGDLLRRALRAEADAVVPSPDGLEIIRSRIQRRGARSLFWWRAGAAVGSAVLVAGTIVMAVPQLRSQVVGPQFVLPAGEETTDEVPSNSSTKRSQPPPPERTAPSFPAVVPETSRPPTPKASRRAESTNRPPSPSPTPTTSECPSPQAAEQSDCPTISPSSTPTALDPSVPPSECPAEQCPPEDPLTETPTEVASPLADEPQTTP